MGWTVGQNKDKLLVGCYAATSTTLSAAVSFSFAVCVDAQQPGNKRQFILICFGLLARIKARLPLSIDINWLSMQIATTIFFSECSKILLCLCFLVAWLSECSLKPMIFLKQFNKQLKDSKSFQIKKSVKNFFAIVSTLMPTLVVLF